MFRRQTPEQERATLERLKALFRQLDSQWFPWEQPDQNDPNQAEVFPDFERLPEFQEWMQHVQRRGAVTKSHLTYFWWLHHSFRSIWKREQTFTAPKSAEVALLLILLNRPIPGPSACTVVESWWDWWKIPIAERPNLQDALRVAEAEAQPYLAELKYKQELIREARRKRKKPAQIIRMLNRVGPMKAKQISITLATERESDHQALTKKEMDANRKMLSRMVEDGRIVSVQRGFFELPLGWTEKTPPRMVDNTLDGVLDGLVLPRHPPTAAQLEVRVMTRRKAGATSNPDEYYMTVLDIAQETLGREISLEMYSRLIEHHQFLIWAASQEDEFPFLFPQPV